MGGLLAMFGKRALNMCSRGIPFAWLGKEKALSAFSSGSCFCYFLSSMSSQNKNFGEAQYRDKICRCCTVHNNQID